MRYLLYVDPLVLNLNGDGVKLTDYQSAPVLFDIDHDGGSKEQAGWVSSQDGIVVYDLNSNGQIDHIGETLSEYFNGTVGTNGNAGTKPYTHGLAALKSLDSNNDNVFNNLDTAWSNVKVWVDDDHNGISFKDTNANGVLEAGEVSELKTLTELGITSINLTSTSQSGLVRDGNEVLATGSFTQNIDAAGQGVPVGTIGSSSVTREAIAANFLANPNGSSSSTVGSGTQVTTQGNIPAQSVAAYVSRFDPSFGGTHPAAVLGETIDLATGTVTTPTAAGANTVTTLPGAAGATRNAYGSNGNDTLTGDASNNWLAGGAGSDTFNAGTGDDVLLKDGSPFHIDTAANAHTQPQFCRARLRTIGFDMPRLVINPIPLTHATRH